MRKIEPNAAEMTEIKELCAQYGHDENNSIVVRNICIIIRTEKSGNLKYGRNEFLLSNSDVISYKYFPSAPMTVMCLIGYWETPRSNDEMPSGQVAKQAQTLRELGFVFRTEQKQNGTTKNNYTFKVGDKECREIVDFDPKAEAVKNNWNKLSKKHKAILRSIHDVDFLGNHCLPKDREIDHRMPEAARKREGKKTIHLTQASLKDGSYDENYQVISKSTNDKKRQSCEECMKGVEIPLPLSMEPFRSFYRQKYDDNTNVCENCFWYNSLNPKNTIQCPDLIQAKAKHQKKVKEVMSKIK